MDKLVYYYRVSADEDEDYDFYIDPGELEDALVDIIYDDFFSEIDDDKEDEIKDALGNLLSTVGINTVNALADWYESELKEYFQDDADEQYWEEHNEI